MRLSLRLQSACVKAPSIRPFLCGIFVYECVLTFVGNADSIRFNVLKKEERCLFSFSDAKAHVVIGVAVVAVAVAQLISIFFLFVIINKHLSHYSAYLRCSLHSITLNKSNWLNNMQVHGGEHSAFSFDCRLMSLNAY